MHGLHISPDLDTVSYTLSGRSDDERGWGLSDETWVVMEALDELGGDTWMRLGDHDLATHLYRTGRLSDGATLSEVTSELCAAFGVPARLVPMSDDPVQDTVAADRWARGRLPGLLRQAAPRGSGEQRPLRRRGDGAARTGGPRSDQGCRGDDHLPLQSDPVDRPVARRRRDRRCGPRPACRDRGGLPHRRGAALKGPADRLMHELGHEPSVVGVARIYRDLAATLIIDEADEQSAAAVEQEGMRCVVARTVMSDPRADRRSRKDRAGRGPQT